MAERRRLQERNQQIAFRGVTPDILKGLSALPDSCISVYSFRTKNPRTGLPISISINTGRAGDPTHKKVSNLSVSFLAMHERDGEAILGRLQEILDSTGMSTTKRFHQTEHDRSFSGNVHITATFELGGFADRLLPPWKSKIAELANILTESRFGTLTDCTLDCRGLNSTEGSAIKQQVDSASGTARSPRMS